MSHRYSASRHRTAALVVLAVLAPSSLTFGGPFRWIKVENPVRYIQLAVHLLTPADGIAHPIAPPGTFWATPYSLAGAPAAAVTGTSRHLVAPCPGEVVPGPLHRYALTVTPAIPPVRATAYARILHRGPPLHPDLFVEVLAATPAAEVFADLGVHDPPPGTCPVFQAVLTGESEVPPTPSDAIGAAALTIYTPDSTLGLSLVVQGVTPDRLISSAIHLGAEGTTGPPIFDLGPGPEWTDLDGIAIARPIEDAAFPPEFVDALLHGETYLNLCTIEHPDGEIRGQITLVPWEEDFDRYPTGSGMHGQGGWKGWDDDPAWTAYVTDTQCQSPPNSVDIAGDSDLVHEFSGCSSGQWAFTAWAYVPGDFESGCDASDNCGSYFILLNTYNDGGPYNWSCQLHADSVTGTFIRDGAAPASLPLITDRWVEVKVLIDLDEDLYRVFYDTQELGTAESWTAGVYGGGGGALDIGALDLFANQSTSLFWDDLSLAPYRAECPGDLDGDGDVDLSDLAQLLAHYGMTSGAEYEDGDLDGDGDVDLADLAALLSVYGTGCD